MASNSSSSRLLFWLYYLELIILCLTLLAGEQIWVLFVTWIRQRKVLLKISGQFDLSGLFESSVFTRESRMLRASLPSSGRLSVCVSVCPSVCLSVTLVSCIKTVQARITKSSLWAVPRSLVYRDKISCHWVQGFPSNEGVEQGYPLKKTPFCRYWLE